MCTRVHCTIILTLVDQLYTMATSLLGYSTSSLSHSPQPPLDLFPSPCACLPHVFVASVGHQIEKGGVGHAQDVKRDANHGHFQELKEHAAVHDVAQDFGREFAVGAFHVAADDHVGHKGHGRNVPENDDEGTARSRERVEIE